MLSYAEKREKENRRRDEMATGINKRVVSFFTSSLHYFLSRPRPLSITATFTSWEKSDHDVSHSDGSVS